MLIIMCKHFAVLHSSKNSALLLSTLFSLLCRFNNNFLISPTVIFFYDFQLSTFLNRPSVLSIFNVIVFNLWLLDEFFHFPNPLSSTTLSS